MVEKTEIDQLFRATALYACRTGLDSLIDLSMMAQLSGFNLSIDELEAVVENFVERGIAEKSDIAEAVLDKDRAWISLTTSGARIAVHIFESTLPDLNLQASPPKHESKFVPFLELDDEYSELENRIVLELFRNPKNYTHPDDDSHLDFTKLVYELDLDPNTAQFSELLLNLDHARMINIEDEDGSGVIFGNLTVAGAERGRFIDYILRDFDRGLEKPASLETIPAADRLVTRTDNQDLIEETSELVDTALQKIEQSNEHFDPETERAIYELQLGRRLLEAPQFSAQLAERLLVSSMNKILSKISDNIVNIAVSAAVSAAVALIKAGI